MLGWTRRRREVERANRREWVGRHKRERILYHFCSSLLFPTQHKQQPFATHWKLAGSEGNPPSTIFGSWGLWNEV